MLFSKLIKFFSLLFIFALLVGCQATHTAFQKRKLDVQTKMSATIFLDPVTAEKKTVFLQIRNTSDKAELNLVEPVIARLADKGYQVVALADEAHYLLQVNLLQVGRSDLRGASRALDRGFGAAISGAAMGGTLGGLSAPKQKHNKKVLSGGLMGATVALAADAMVQDVLYCLITDIQISERMGNSVSVKEKTKSNLKQGTRGVLEVTSTEKIDWKRYQTRVVSTANQVNLRFDKAAPFLVEGLAHSITGIF